MATHRLEGRLDPRGYMIQFGTFRYHGGGQVRLSPRYYSGSLVDGAARFGLRNTSDVQVTSSVEWKYTQMGATAYWQLPAGSYALNGRQVVPTGLLPPGIFALDLTIR